MSFDDSANITSSSFNGTCFVDSSESSCTCISTPSINKEKFCKEAKCKLVEYDALPDYLKDNEFIVGHYRCEWPLKETVLSIFSIHNETVNVWTHLIGFFVFLALTVLSASMLARDGTTFSWMQREAVASMSPSTTLTNELQNMQANSSNWHIPQLIVNCFPGRFSQSNNQTNHACFLNIMKEDVANILSPLMVKPITRWPFFAFMFGAMLCLLTSSICHLILCHSEKMAYIMLRLDYVGITALIVTSFFPLVYYTFLCDPFYCNLYMGFITSFGVATILASLLPVFQTVEFRPVRAGLFFCMGVSGLVPIVHKLIEFHDRPDAIVSAGYELLMGAFYGLGVIVYVTRVPERWMPGKFDIVGHSHQLFHVLVIAGAYTHYLAGLSYLKWRDTEMC